jgi:hypothetical protein
MFRLRSKHSALQYNCTKTYNSEMKIYAEVLRTGVASTLLLFEHVKFNLDTYDKKATE